MHLMGKLPAVAAHTGGLYFGIFQEHPWKYFPDVDLPVLSALSLSTISFDKQETIIGGCTNLLLPVDMKG